MVGDVDTEVRELSIFILPCATVSFTAALLGLDNMVDNDRAGRRGSVLWLDTVGDDDV